MIILKKINIKKGMIAVFLNAYKFAMIMAFILGYMKLFGQANILPGVAVLVGLMTIPICDFGMKPITMSVTIIVLFIGSGIVSQLIFTHIYLGSLLSFMFVCGMLLVTCEPKIIKPYITFILSYVFCLMAPVNGHDFILRMAGLLAGSLAIVAVSLTAWLKHRPDTVPRTVKEQVQLSYKNNRNFIVRMAVGLTLAMLIGILLQLKKPGWIAIAVMSITQFEWRDSVERMKYRSIATIIGSILIVILLKLIIPSEYSFLLILFLGYLGNFNFIKPYKYQQVINTINAIYASFVLFSMPEAIVNRIMCLMLGIVIVFFMKIFFWGCRMLCDETIKNTNGVPEQ